VCLNTGIQTTEDPFAEEGVAKAFRMVEQIQTDHYHADFVVALPRYVSYS